MNRFIIASEEELGAAEIFEGDQTLEFLHGRLSEAFEGVQCEG